ncbi:hypothetical protein ES706_05889 [subsurface metagenome]
MSAQRYERMEEILSTIDILTSDGATTTVKDLYEFIKNSQETFDDPDITINIIDSAIRHYRKSGLVRRKHNPYIKPFQYKLSKKGIEKLEWLENEEYLNYVK